MNGTSSMTSEQIVELSLRHTLFDWQAQSAVRPIAVDHAKGCEFFTPEGKRYLDFNSQLWSVNIGHGDPRVVRAIAEQAEKLAYVSPFMATEVRARLGEKLAELLPGDMEKVFFTLGGAEANENALRMARAVTGRNKVLARYRSYHGATYATVSLTGDPRRWGNEPSMPGVIHVLDPYHGTERAGRRRRDIAPLPRGDDRARRSGDDRRVLPGARARDQRRPGPARWLPPGRPRALRPVRHLDDRRRGDVRASAAPASGSP